MRGQITVFISSVMSEFAVERRATVEALSALGFLPLVAEDHPSTARSPREVCLGLARDCDVYVGILGAEYGTVLPGTGRSPTELEFEEATRVSPDKVLLYVKHCVPRSPKQKAFIRRTEDFTSGYFRRPRFGTVDELVSFVCEDVVRWVCSRVPDPAKPAPNTDASEFVRDVTIPDGTLVRAGSAFTKTWEIRNAGQTPWANRRLRRIGAASGPGLISSPQQVGIPDTSPGETVRVSVRMRAPDVAGTTTCLWKMVDASGQLCFPDRYSYGLLVTINVTEN